MSENLNFVQANCKNGSVEIPGRFANLGRGGLLNLLDRKSAPVPKAINIITTTLKL